MTELPLTRSRNALLAVPPFASATVIVIVLAPDWPVAGVTVTVRFPPLPPKRMLFVGASTGLEEALERTRLATAVSTSLMLNGIAALAVLRVTV